PREIEEFFSIFGVDDGPRPAASAAIGGNELVRPEDDAILPGSTSGLEGHMVVFSVVVELFQQKVFIKLGRFDAHPQSGLFGRRLSEAWRGGEQQKNCQGAEFHVRPPRDCCAWLGHKISAGEPVSRILFAAPRDRSHGATRRPFLWSRDYSRD